MRNAQKRWSWVARKPIAPMKRPGKSMIHHQTTRLGIHLRTRLTMEIVRLWKTTDGSVPQAQMLKAFALI